MGKGAGLSADAIANARHGKGDAVAVLTQQVLQARGQINYAELAEARSAGLSDAQIVEVVAAVAINVLTNYLNNLAGTDIDFPRVDLYAWRGTNSNDIILDQRSCTSRKCWKRPSPINLSAPSRHAMQCWNVLSRFTAKHSSAERKYWGWL